MTQTLTVTLPVTVTVTVTVTVVESFSGSYTQSRDTRVQETLSSFKTYFALSTSVLSLTLQMKVHTSV